MWEIVPSQPVMKGRIDPNITWSGRQMAEHPKATELVANWLHPTLGGHG